jgi:hypothetical protein
VVEQRLIETTRCLLWSLPPRWSCRCDIASTYQLRSFGPSRASFSLQASGASTSGAPGRHLLHHPDGYGRFDVMSWIRFDPRSSRRSRRQAYVADGSRANLLPLFRWFSLNTDYAEPGSGWSKALPGCLHRAHSPQPSAEAGGARLFHHRMRPAIRRRASRCGRPLTRSGAVDLPAGEIR